MISSGYFVEKGMEEREAALDKPGNTFGVWGHNIKQSPSIFITRNKVQNINCNSLILSLCRLYQARLPIRLRAGARLTGAILGGPPSRALRLYTEEIEI